jgi:hypothetical protein
VQNKGLLFIPDISGFTRFVNETEIGHSRLILQELLELIINSNKIGLEISEIEGDAVLFYKFGEPPDLKEIYSQVEKMFCEFHSHLMAYENRRYCQCKACHSAINLTLKIITHYGEFTDYNVKGFNKLIGKDVIVAHQLLKNEIEQHEYWLITPVLVGRDDSPVLFTDWMKWNRSVKETENGNISFHYAQLSQLKSKITPDDYTELDLSDKVNVLSFTKEYETDIITLFHASGDFNYRPRWLEGVKRIEEVDHFLPRVGMRCRYILENGESVIYSSSYSYTHERIEFSETENGNNNITYYTLEKVNNRKTKLTIDVYIDKNSFQQLKFRLLSKKKTNNMYQKSLLNLADLVKEIKLPEANS